MTAAEQTTALLLEGAGEITRLSGQLERTREALRRLVAAVGAGPSGHSAGVYQAWMEDPDLNPFPPCAICQAVDAAAKVLEGQ